VGFVVVIVDKGQFKLTRIIPVLFPSSITIIATAAPFQVNDSTAFRERKTRTFENISLAELFRQVVRAHGFSPRVAPEFENIQLSHVDQMDETDSAFLTRLSRERDAVAKPVNDLYVLVKRGQVKAITGQDIPPVIIGLPDKNDPKDLSRFTNCKLDESSRTTFKGVKAKWTNSNTGQEHDVSVGTKPYKKLRQVYESQERALQACNDELTRTVRNGITIHLDLPGDPDFVAEGIVTLNDSFPPKMAGDWSIDKVSARGGDSYRCSVVATQPADN
jgi:phage protein D